jgi:hypothetical protein
VALDRAQANRLARALRDMRESTWPDREVTQSQLAKALSSEGRVAGPTLSSWESLTNPKTPPVARGSADARSSVPSDHLRANRISYPWTNSRPTNWTGSKSWNPDCYGGSGSDGFLGLRTWTMIELSAPTVGAGW